MFLVTTVTPQKKVQKSSKSLLQWVLSTQLLSTSLARVHRLRVCLKIASIGSHLPRTAGDITASNFLVKMVFFHGTSWEIHGLQNGIQWDFSLFFIFFHYFSWDNGITPSIEKGILILRLYPEDTKEDM